MNAQTPLKPLPITRLIKGCALFLLLGLPLSLWAAQKSSLNATLDRYTISEGETVLLLIEAKGSLTGDPQLKVLNKDFEVLGTSQSTSLSIINGSRQDSVRWQTTLSPRRSGQLSIPAIQVGNQTTQPLSLNVLSASSSLPQNSNTGGVPAQTTLSATPSVFLEVIVDNKQPHIQQQVLYTLRLYSEQTITGGTLSDPQADDLLVKRLREDSNYRSQRNGHNYQVIERQYALFPQRLGKIKIPSPIFDGKVAVPNTQRRQSRNRFGGLFDDVFGDPFMAMRQSSKRVRLRGDNAELDVVAALSNPASWLPASDVQFTETSEIVNRVKLGDPITRILRIQATGLSAAQLPALSLSDNTSDRGSDPLSRNFKSYPDKATLKDQTNGHDIIGTREQQWALIAQRPGVFTLPEIELKWWNTQTQRQQIARLPAREIEVIAPAGYQPPTTQQPTAPAIPAQQQSPILSPSSEVDIENQTAAEAASNSKLSASSASQRIKQYGLTGFFALLWLITLILWLRTRSSTPFQPTAPPTGKPRTNQAAKAALKQLEKAKHPADARKAILAWGKSQYPTDTPNGLTELANRLNNELMKAAFSEIDLALYAPENQQANNSNSQEKPSWNTRQLSRDLALLEKNKKKEKSLPEHKLPELYDWKH